MPRPVPPPPLEELLTRLGEGGRLLQILELVASSAIVDPRGKYRHWDNIRQLQPPAGLTSEEWWLGIKMARRSSLREFGLRDSEGSPFVYSTPDQILKLLHYVDQHASGELSMSEVVGDESARGHFLVNSLIEEAIRSSQLEGATTTRAVAKEMIRSGREPEDKSERMILNNYRAMEFIREEMSDRLTPEAICELQRVVTDGTLEDPKDAGRIQTPSDQRIAIWDDRGRIVHSPPPAEQLPKRMRALCEFANATEPVKGFLHPVLRSILLHFWLAYDHPFVDGNGRTARALFYWSMKGQGYWLTEYISISSILRRAPAQYSRAFLYTETDEGDTTYFVLYQLEVIQRAIEELRTYLQRKIEEVRNFELSVRGSEEFNHRQLSLLVNAVRHPSQRYTFRSHAISHRVTHQTARVDLLHLRDQGLLELRKSGRQFVFAPVANLAQRLSPEEPRLAAS